MAEGGARPNGEWPGLRGRHAVGGPARGGAAQGPPVPAGQPGGGGQRRPRPGEPDRGAVRRPVPAGGGGHHPGAGREGQRRGSGLRQRRGRQRPGFRRQRPLRLRARGGPALPHGAGPGRSAGSGRDAPAGRAGGGLRGGPPHRALLARRPRRVPGLRLLGLGGLRGGGRPPPGPARRTGPPGPGDRRLPRPQPAHDARRGPPGHGQARHRLGRPDRHPRGPAGLLRLHGRSQSPGPRANTLPGSPTSEPTI